MPTFYLPGGLTVDIDGSNWVRPKSMGGSGYPHQPAGEIPTPKPTPGPTPGPTPSPTPGPTPTPTPDPTPEPTPDPSPDPGAGEPSLLQKAADLVEEVVKPAKKRGRPAKKKVDPSPSAD